MHTDTAPRGVSNPKESQAMARRVDLSSRHSAAMFARGNRIHPRNNQNPMRGGIRL